MNSGSLSRNGYRVNNSGEQEGFSVADHREMVEAISQLMPFGKFKGTALLDLPEPYIVWFKSWGFPEGRLGRQMALVYEIKLNGLEPTFRPLLQVAGRSDNSSD